jgi:hypothetical protein
LTFIVSVKLKQGPVKASAGLSLLVAVLFYLFPHMLPAYLTTKIPAAFFGASFVGMSAGSVLRNNLWATLAGLIFGFIFTNTSAFFNGFGGGLGTTACLSVLTTLGFVHLLSFVTPAGS